MSIFFNIKDFRLGELYKDEQTLVKKVFLIRALQLRDIHVSSSFKILKVDNCSPKNVKRLSFPKSLNILFYNKGSIKDYWILYPFRQLSDVMED